MNAVWIAFTVGMFLGAAAGVMIACLMAMAGRTSREIEEIEARRELS